jgi:hypothetical protein
VIPSRSRANTASGKRKDRLPASAARRARRPCHPIFASASRAARGEAILSTAYSIFWTTRRVSPVDFPWEEVSVTAYSLAFPEILGSRVSGRRKDTIEVWIDEGPTVTLRTERSGAQRLSEYVDTAAASI